jgi:hypothetical protein
MLYDGEEIFVERPYNAGSTWIKMLTVKTAAGPKISPRQP